MESTRPSNRTEGEERAEQRRDRCNELRALMDEHRVLSSRLKSLSDQFLALGDEQGGIAHAYWARMLPLLEEDTRLLDRARTVGSDICGQYPQV